MKRREALKKVGMTIAAIGAAVIAPLSALASISPRGYLVEDENFYFNTTTNPMRQKDILELNVNFAIKSRCNALNNYKGMLHTTLKDAMATRGCSPYDIIPVYTS